MVSPNKFYQNFFKFYCWKIFQSLKIQRPSWKFFIRTKQVLNLAFIHILPPPLLILQCFSLFFWTLASCFSWTVNVDVGGRKKICLWRNQRAGLSFWIILYITISLKKHNKNKMLFLFCGTLSFFLQNICYLHLFFQQQISI